MLLLPYDSCKDQWLRIVDSEVTKNRAVGVLLVIFRSDASEVAPEVKVGPDELSVPAWVVNGIVGAYITEGLNYEHKDRASRNSSITSTGNVWVEVERSKKLAITRKSFFFKAMIGIGIMGTLCFVLGKSPLYPQRRARDISTSLVSFVATAVKGTSDVWRDMTTTTTTTRVSGPGLSPRTATGALAPTSTTANAEYSTSTSWPKSPCVVSPTASIWARKTPNTLPSRPPRLPRAPF
ncbi:hypothetical protein EV182_007460, partial [Spiromyces aspiralis]